jgi:hypothetical protein
MRRALHAVWDYLKDLGNGAWLLIAGGVVVVVLVVAVIQGRSGPDQQPCDQAEQHMNTISRLSQSGRLSQVEAAQLHNAAAQLGAIGRTAVSDEKRAINNAAAAAAGAQAGQPFNAVEILDEFDAACPHGGLG